MLGIKNEYHYSTVHFSTIQFSIVQYSKVKGVNVNTTFDFGYEEESTDYAEGRLDKEQLIIC